MAPAVFLPGCKETIPLSLFQPAKIFPRSYRKRQSSLFNALSDQHLMAITLIAMYTIVNILPPLPQSLDMKRTLSHVCRRWRYLILKENRLWSTFQFFPRPIRNPHGILAFTTLCLSRHRLIPGRGIDLTFRDGNADASTSDSRESEPYAYQLQYGQGMIDIVHSILLPFAAQIRTLEWKVYTEPMIKSFFAIPAGTFSQLENIQISFFNELHRPTTYFTLEELKNINVFRDLPMLRYATVQILNGLHPLSLHLPMHTLRVLNLENTPMSPQTFMTVIHRSSASLVEGCFYIKFTRCPKYRDPGPIRRACGKHLRVLRLRLANPHKDDRMFDRLSLPALEKLQVDVDDHKPSRILSFMTKMLKDSSATLDSLTLCDAQLLPFVETTTRVFPQLVTHPTELESLFKVIYNIQSDLVDQR